MIRIVLAVALLSLRVRHERRSHKLAYVGRHNLASA